MDLGPLQVITAYYLCLTVEVLGTMVVFLGRRVQLLENNAQRASMALSVRYVPFFFSPLHSMMICKILQDLSRFIKSFYGGKQFIDF